jgi:ankyrin repeat protein
LVGFTLHWACININKLLLDIFKVLIDVNVQDVYQDTPIHNALSFFDPDDGGDINVLTYLLNQEKIDANIKGEDGYTLLHLACISRRSVELNAAFDTTLCHIVELIVQRYVQHNLDETTP